MDIPPCSHLEPSDIRLTSILLHTNTQYVEVMQSGYITFVEIAIIVVE